MQRTLILMRHAEAAIQSLGVTDEQRPLTQNGRTEAEAAGRKLTELQLAPTLALASTAVRTKETVDLATAQIPSAIPVVRLDERLYLAEPRQMFQVIAEVPAAIQALLVVGHNPGISEAFASLVQIGARGFPTGAFAVIAFESEDWQTGLKAGGVLQAFR